MDDEPRVRSRPAMKTSIQMVFSFILVALLCLSLYDPGMWSYSKSGTLIAAWFMMGILAIVIFVDLWESIMLLKLAKEGTEQVLHGASICRNVVIGLLAFFIVF